jgi:long-chain acyl-CoA synthetase
VREYSTPLTAPLPTSGGLTDDVVRNAADSPDAVAFLRRSDDPRPDGDTRWAAVTAAAFHDDVRRAAAGLLAAGVAPGDRVALLSRTRYEWTVLDYAIWWVGGVGVPIYPNEGPDQVGHVVGDSGARWLVVERAVQRDRLRDTLAALPVPPRTWVIEGDGEQLADLTSAVGPRLGADLEDALERRRAGVGPDDLATILYTSGTTAPPKGCPLTHGNLRAAVAGVLEALPELFEPPPPEGDEPADLPTTVLFLPLAHELARVVQVAAVRAGVRLAHLPDLASLEEDLAGVRPTFLVGVPRVFEQLYNRASQRAAAEGRGRRFDRATETAIAWSRALEGRAPSRRWSSRARRGPGPLLRLRHRVADRAVLGELRDTLGGRCRWAVSGGAALGERLAHLYRGIGVPVLEGYGLTETAGPVTLNTPTATAIGSGGRPLPGVTVRVSHDGELLVSGPQVGKGYWNDPEATAAARDRGWLRTGDLGEIDADGFVRVTGRRREVLVTAGGKAVAPALLEDRIRAHPLVDQCLVVGDGKPYVAALVTLDHDALAAWADRNGKPRDSTRLATDPDLLAEVQRAVDEANLAVSKAEAVRRFRVLATTWTEDGGQLTSSLKVKRRVVLQQNRSEIEQLYALDRA